MSNVIGPQHHTINVVNAQMTHLQHLLDHINHHDRFNLGDYVTIIGNQPPSTFIIKKTIQPVNTGSETESQGSSSSSGADDDDDADSVVEINPRQRNNALTPNPTSGLRLGSLGTRSPNVIGNGGAKRTRKRKRTRRGGTTKRGKKPTRRSGGRERGRAH